MLPFSLTSGDIALVTEILARYSQLPEYSGIALLHVNQVSLFGDRPINVAATRGSIPEMAALVLAGANVNSAGEHGYTPLHNAVEQGEVDAVEWLLDHGADPSVADNAGSTPRDLAVVLSEGELADMLDRADGRGLR
jgi:ankyrin repeat protein